MIGGTLVVSGGYYATAVVALTSATASTTTFTNIDYATEVLLLPAREERVFFGIRAARPWVASSVAGRIPVVVELRAGRRKTFQAPHTKQGHRPTWASALRAFHRDPRGLSSEAR